MSLFDLLAVILACRCLLSADCPRPPGAVLVTAAIAALTLLCVIVPLAFVYRPMGRYLA